VLLLVGAEGGGVIGLEFCLGFAGIVGGLESLALFIVVVVVCFASDGFLSALSECSDQSFASCDDLSVVELGEGAGSFGVLVTEGLLGSATVQIMTFQHMNRCLKSEPLAERPKSKQESGLNMPILQFS